MLSFFGLVPAVRELPLAHEFLAPYARGETFRTAFLTQRTAGTVGTPERPRNQVAGATWPAR